MYVDVAAADWDEDDIMAQVMALSHQEYLDSLKQRATPSTSSASATITTSDLGFDGAGCSTSADPGFPFCDS